MQVIARILNGIRLKYSMGDLKEVKLKKTVLKTRRKLFFCKQCRRAPFFREGYLKIKNKYLKPIQSRVGDISHLLIYSRLWFSLKKASEKKWELSNPSSSCFKRLKRPRVLRSCQKVLIVLGLSILWYHGLLVDEKELNLHDTPAGHLTLWRKTWIIFITTQNQPHSAQE